MQLKAGKYLGRQVVMVAGADLQNKKLLEVTANALVCFMFTRPVTDFEVIPNLLKSILGNNPLAVAFWGHDAAYAFDIALKLLAVPTSKHVMTKLIEETDMQDAVDDFLRATWPTGERFDDWNSYVFLVVGGEDEIQKAQLVLVNSLIV